MGRLDNKKIVVCGGSTGIGHAVSVLAEKKVQRSSTLICKDG